MLKSTTASIYQSVEDQLEEHITSTHSVSGGCISDACKINTETGKSYFLKFGSQQPGIYEKEARGLVELSKAGCIRIPKVLLVEQDFLVLEWIESGGRKTDFFDEFGTSLAMMHRYVQPKFGFREDNYLGSAPQKNIPSRKEERDWKTFYWNKRLIFQLKWAEQQGLASQSLVRSFAALEERYDKIMQDTENIPVLLHGDLWSGNFLTSEDGGPVLIDPAVYYGNREAELAMTRLFGGFDEEFYRAYEQAYPLPVGAEERINLYKLYHILNHLNLFGTSYLKEAESLVKYYL